MTVDGQFSTQLEWDLPASGSDEAIYSDLGWSVLGYHNAELGVGAAARELERSILLSGAPVERVGLPSFLTSSRQQHQLSRGTIEYEIHYPNVVTCVNADQLPLVSRGMDLRSCAGVHAGLWWWELADFPDRFHRAFKYIDEVWVATEFIKNSISPHTDKPVRLITLPVQFPLGPTRFTRRSLGLPEDRFVFLTNFDFFSAVGRKNPIGTILAYCEAFTPTDGVALVVKSINGAKRPEDFEMVRSLVHNRPDIIIIDGYLSGIAMTSMIELADVYVSLHRAEGLGLNILDAMSHRTPVISTAYGGNMDYMTSETTELIPFELTRIGHGNEPYDADLYWADPDINAAASAMRRLYDEPKRADQMVSKAFELLESKYSSKVVGQHMSATLDAALLRKEQEWNRG